MNTLFDFILQGSASLTDPRCMVGIIVFITISDGIFTLVSSAVKGVTKL